MNHIIYFGEHPRPGVFKLEVQPGLSLYFDDQGRTHSLASIQPIGTSELIAALGAVRPERKAVDNGA